MTASGPESTMPSVLITRPFDGSGVGSNIASFIGALHLARLARAKLVVDWTALNEIRDKRLNAFRHFLETPPVLMGIAIEHADYGDYPDRVSLPTDRSALRSIASGEAPRIAQLTRYHGMERIRELVPELALPPDEEADFLRRAYLAIRLRERHQSKLDAWTAEHFGSSFVVGVNVRMGNGLFDKGAHFRLRVNTHVFRSERVFCAGLERALAHVKRNLPDGTKRAAKTFFAADSRDMHRWLVDRPGFVTRRTVFPPPGVGHAFAEYDQAGYDDVTAFEDILLDMFALARCDALIYNGTAFNLLARHQTNFFSGNYVNIEKFFPLEQLLHRFETGVHSASVKLGLRK